MLVPRRKGSKKRTGRKDTSADVVVVLKKLGCDVWMVTGDNEMPARAVAQSVGMDNVIAGVFPSQKDERIPALRSDGRFTVMVGDGVNDAAALTSADGGLAIGTGIDIATESADIVLMKKTCGMWWIQYL